MRSKARTCLATFVLLMSFAPARAESPNATELTAAKQWVQAVLLAEKARKPFSALCDGKPLGAMLRQTVRKQTRVLDKQRSEHTLIWEDATTGLQVRCLAIEYSDFPAVEWVLWFKNIGKTDTPIIQNILPLDIILDPVASEGAHRLFYADGSHQSSAEFELRETELLAAGDTFRLSSFGGRSSEGHLPFFNVAKPDGGGVIAGIGWTGQWAATFQRNRARALQVRAGMEITRLKLHPGEEIRTPAALLLFWSGADRLRSQNLLRSLLLEHYSPTPGGKRVKLPIAASPHHTIGFEKTSEANMLEGIKNVAQHKLPVDAWWIDAGWINCGTQNWARSNGNHSPDPLRYPNGLKPVADAVHRNCMKLVLWFEPERVMPDTEVYRDHREWLIPPPPNLPFDLSYMQRAGFHLLDLGNRDALEWLKARIGGMIEQIGVDVYRQDFNMYPLDYWRAGEQPDRLGMREIKHVMGLYEFWDALRQRFPNLLIDNCASGGRRIDFEMLRRSVVLWRSDMCWPNYDAMQSMTWGLSHWIPIHGVGSNTTSPYGFRSGMGATATYSLNYYNDPAVWETADRLLNQYKSIRHLFTGDFHPLTPYSLKRDAWIAWQFQRPDLGEILVQAFRRADAKSEMLNVKLRGLTPDARYEVKDLDGTTETRTGRELAAGFAITLKNKPAAAVFVLRKARP